MFAVRSSGPARLSVGRGGGVADRAMHGPGLRPRLMHGSRALLNPRLDTRAMLLPDGVGAIHSVPLNRLPVMDALGVLPHALMLDDARAVLLALDARALVLRLRAMALLHIGAAFVPNLPALLLPRGAV